MTMIRKITMAAAVASLLASSALADSAGADTSGKMAFKARVGYMGNTVSSKDGSVSFALKAGYVGEVATNYFLTDNFAIEGALGYGRIKEKGEDGDTLSIIPLTATVQYHFAPDASVNPYVGLGYSYRFMKLSDENIKIKNGGGVVGQIGADIPFNDTMGFNIDLKHTFKASHKIKALGEEVGTVKLSTTTVMVGVTFPF